MDTILIFGGTTEGRIAVDVCEQAGRTFFYSTKGTGQSIEMCNGKRLCGAMSADEIVSFCRANNARLIVDAAHPFATGLHSEIAATGLPVVRLQRNFGKRVDGVVYCKDYADAIARMEQHGVERLLVLSGANTILPLKPFWEKHKAVFRILDRDESRALAHRAGVTDAQIVYLPQPQSANDEALTSIINDSPFTDGLCDAIITKESGDTGGFAEKVEAALSRGIKVFAIEHPPLPSSFITATGPHTLRRAIEQLLPDFFPLRTGLTTGACATAATKAAMLALLYGDSQEAVHFSLPNGETLAVDVDETTIGDGWAESVVAKDFSDDPDVTKGCKIHSRVSFSPVHCDTGVRFLQGSGVGTATLPGLGIDVGEPAINPVPRQMMTSIIQELTDKAIDVQISVEGGEELARRTFNERVGVVGGISIIGTSGIVRPLSNEAFIESIRREMQVARAMGCEHVALVSGMKSEKSLSHYIDDARFIHYGNAIGDSLQLASSLGFKRITLGLMIGKAVKLAEGHLDTHSHKVVMNKAFLAQLAADSGCSSATVSAINSITMAKDLWSCLPSADSQRFFSAIINKCLHHCLPLVPSSMLTITLIDEQGYPH